MILLYKFHGFITILLKRIKLKKITDIKFFNKHIDIDFFVYQKKEDIYGNPVIREFLDTRSIHWCPKYQK